MKITITAHCAYCARLFPVLDAQTEILGRTGVLGDAVFCEDLSGKLCCLECLCDYCGHGHSSTAARDECDQLDMRTLDESDGDAFRDAALDVRAGVI